MLQRLEAADWFAELLASLQIVHGQIGQAGHAPHGFRTQCETGPIRGPLKVGKPPMFDTQQGIER
ncbi:hypothetical protein D3C87_2149930 [compost metagenome]